MSESNNCTAITRAGSPCRRKRERGSQFCQAHRPQDVIKKALDGIEKPRCRYTKRNGERCRNSPIQGGTVCKKHGGAAAHVQRKAQERLQAMVNPALVELNKILSNDRTSDGDKLRAITMVLDRTGFGKGVTVEHVQDKPWMVTMEHIVTELPELNLPEGHQPYTPPALEDIEDADVIDDEPPLPVNMTRIGPINGGTADVIRRGREPEPRRDRREFRDR